MLKKLLIEKAKKIAFRSNALNFLSRPRYGFGIEPNQLAWLVEAINKTHNSSLPVDELGCIVEVGVARGMTSTFLLKHLRDIGDKRKIFFIDTFSGFVEEDIAFEESERGKDGAQMDVFTYNDKNVFEKNLRRNGFDNFEVIEGDASQFDFSKLPSIDVMLSDVDLYKPTLAILRNSKENWASPSFIMIDDVAAEQTGVGGLWDGSLQAYEEFAKEHGLPTKVIGNKGGVIENP